MTEYLTPPPIPAPHRDLISPPKTLTFRVLLWSLSMLEIRDLADSNATAQRSLIAYRWPYGVWCPYCGSKNVRECRSHKPPNERLVYFACEDCKDRFSVRTGYFLAKSPLSFKTWLWALYLVTTASELEPVTPASLTRQLGVSEASAEYMIRRIRDHIRDTR